MIYAGTQHGPYRSQDHGDHWEKVDEPVGLLVAAIDRYIAHQLHNPTGILNEQGFLPLRRSMISAGFITTGASYAECLDNSFSDL